MVASLSPRVVDGTTCYRGIRHICIGGICREIPCDLNMESNAIEDACGVCKGNGTSCSLKAYTTTIVQASRECDPSFFLLPPPSTKFLRMRLFHRRNITGLYVMSCSRLRYSFMRVLLRVLLRAFLSKVVARIFRRNIRFYPYFFQMIL